MSAFMTKSSRNTTIQDIARELKVTAATVSRALNNHPRISEATKIAVAKMADKLNYTRNRVASSLRSGKTNVIGVIIPSAKINFFGSVVHGIETMANESGYNVLIYQSNEDTEYEKKGLQAFLSARVDGILASIAKETKSISHYEEVIEKNVPLVFFDRISDDENIPSVSIDDYKGGYLATEHLIRQGYKCIAHVSGQQHLKIFRERLRGYRAALKDYGIPFDKNLIYTGNVSLESGRDAVMYFLSLPKPPDAIFAVEDFTALGVLKTLKEKKIDIPEQIGVVGFANEEFDEHITPALTSVDQQTVLMGKEAFRLIMELIDKKAGRQTKRSVVLEPLLQLRASSQR